MVTDVAMTRDGGIVRHDHVVPDLEPSVREQAHQDLISLVLHLIRHDYQMTGLDGRPTKYGSLRPLLWGHGVPFNAHVAYMVIATGATFPPRHPEQIRVIEDEFPVKAVAVLLGVGLVTWVAGGEIQARRSIRTV